MDHVELALFHIVYNWSLVVAIQGCHDDPLMLGLRLDAHTHTEQNKHWYWFDNFQIPMMLSPKVMLAERRSLK